MIAPDDAQRIGLTQDFTGLDDAAVALALGRMAGLGFRHLRVVVPAAGGGALASLAGQLAELGMIVLPALSLGDATDVPDWLAPYLAGLGEAVDTVEIAGSGAGLLAVAETIRAGGRHVVLSVWDSAALAAAGEAGVLGACHAVGLHAMPSAAGEPVAWQQRLTALTEAAQRYNPAVAVWITKAGYPAWRHDSGNQAQAFAAAASAPAGRLYWSSLIDQPDATDPAHGQDGLLDAYGQPRLLARLLEGGLPELDRVLATARRLKLPAITATRPVLITGGAGFIGANLADRLAAEGHHVHLYDALVRPGVERNLHWLARRHPNRISFALADLRDTAALTEAATRAEAVFHLAGQVAVTTSMVQPLADFDINAKGTLALLEALRQRNPAAPLIFASTNKVYGDLADIALVRDGEAYLPARADLRDAGVDESRPLCFHTPYGCSKGAADQYVLDYAHSFGLRTAVLRMSCIYGERQLGTEDQGWVAHFLLRAIAGEGLTIYGDGRQVRDVLHVGDAVAAYMAAWSRIGDIAGRAYNLGGGPANAISLLQLVGHIEDLLGRRVDAVFSDWRPGDQRYFVADTTAARRDLGLAPALHWRAGIARLAEHFGAVTAETAGAAQ